MQEQWHITTDTKEASAFAALGATIKIIASLHQRTASRDVRLFISPTVTTRKWIVGRIRKAVKDKSLFTSDPGHPYITGRRALQNREAILDIQNKGTRCRLVPIPGAPEVFQYVPSDTGLPGVVPGDAVVRTPDLKMAAALVTCGFPLLEIRGSAPRHEYTLAAFRIPAARVDAATLLTDWREDASAMPFELPFVQAATTLLFYQQLRTEISKAIDTVLITKGKSHAAIRADAAPAAWDKAAHFFNGTR